MRRMNGSTVGRWAREAKVEKVKIDYAAEQRRELSAKLIRAGFNSEAAKTLQTAVKHIDRATTHGESADSYHAKESGHLDDLGTHLRKLEGMVADRHLDDDHPQIARHLSGARASLRDAKNSLETAADSHVNVRKHVNSAGDLVRSVLVSGLATSEPDSAE